MQIGAVATAVRMTPSAIRYYERKGFIQPIGRIAGRREFDEKSIKTLRFLKLAQSAGFALSETRQLLDIGFGDTRPQAEWQEFLRNKRDALRQQVVEIQQMDVLLEKFEACTCPSLEDCMSDAGQTPAKKKQA